MTTKKRRNLLIITSTKTKSIARKLHSLLVQIVVQRRNNGTHKNNKTLDRDTLILDNRLPTRIVLMESHLYLEAIQMIISSKTQRHLITMLENIENYKSLNEATNLKIWNIQVL